MGSRPILGVEQVAEEKKNIFNAFFMIPVFQMHVILDLIVQDLQCCSLFFLCIIQ